MMNADKSAGDVKLKARQGNPSILAMSRSRCSFLGKGPIQVAMVAGYFFHNDKAVGMSLGIVLAVASLISAAVLFSGSGSCNRVLREAQAKFAARRDGCRCELTVVIPPYRA